MTFGFVRETWSIGAGRRTLMQRAFWVSGGAPGGTRKHARSALRPHSRALPLCLLVLLAAVIAAGCGRAQTASPETQDSFRVTFDTEPAQPAIGPGTLVLTLHDAAGRPVNNAEVTIEANMSHAGMVPVNATASGGQGGVYRVPLRWTMGGDWYVDVRFALSDGLVVGRRYMTQVK